MTGAYLAIHDAGEDESGVDIFEFDAGTRSARRVGRGVLTTIAHALGPWGNGGRRVSGAVGGAPSQGGRF